MCYSIFDIYYETIITFNVKNEQSKRIIFNDIKGVIKNGINDYEIIKHIKDNRKANSWNEVGIRNLCNNKKDKYSINYITGDEIYYHNELRLTPGPPKKTFDIESGEFISVNEKFFLEMKSSYNINNLFEYLKTKTQFVYCVEDELRTKGGLQFLLKKHSMDYLLFLIDTANNVLLDDMKFIQNVLDIDRYHIKALENYNRKKTECVVNGLSNIILKERQLVGSTN